MIENFPDDVSLKLESLVSTGAYVDKADVVRQALALLEHRRADRAAIDAGIADMQEGRSKPREQFEADFVERHNVTK
jgi:Arc/MetJ-type ribon-helix-helix transcriptional regulator